MSIVAIIKRDDLFKQLKEIRRLGYENADEMGKLKNALKYNGDLELNEAEALLVAFVEYFLTSNKINRDRALMALGFLAGKEYEGKGIVARRMHYLKASGSLKRDYPKEYAQYIENQSQTIQDEILTKVGNASLRPKEDTILRNLAKSIATQIPDMTAYIEGVKAQLKNSNGPIIKYRQPISYSVDDKEVAEGENPAELPMQDQENDNNRDGGEITTRHRSGHGGENSLIVSNKKRDNKRSVGLERYAAPRIILGNHKYAGYLSQRPRIIIAGIAIVLVLGLPLTAKGVGNWSLERLPDISQFYGDATLPDGIAQQESIGDSDIIMGDGNEINTTNVFQYPQTREYDPFDSDYNTAGECFNRTEYSKAKVAIEKAVASIKEAEEEVSSYSIDDRLAFRLHRIDVSLLYGNILFSLGDYEAAKEQWLEALGIAEDATIKAQMDSEEIYSIGHAVACAYFSLGNFEAARQEETRAQDTLLADLDSPKRNYSINNSYITLGNCSQMLYYQGDGADESLATEAINYYANAILSYMIESPHREEDYNWVLEITMKDDRKITWAAPIFKLGPSLLLHDLTDEEKSLLVLAYANLAHIYRTYSLTTNTCTILSDYAIQIGRELPLYSEGDLLFVYSNWCQGVLIYGLNNNSLKEDISDRWTEFLEIVNSAMEIANTLTLSKEETMYYCEILVSANAIFAEMDEKEEGVNCLFESLSRSIPIGDEYHTHSALSALKEFYRDEHPIQALSGEFDRWVSNEIERRYS